MILTRRELLFHVALLPLASLVPGGEGDRGHPAADALPLSISEAEMRLKLEYVERSLEPDKQCGSCHFFRLDSRDKKGNGYCKIVKGTVNTKGGCNSWSIRR